MIKFLPTWLPLAFLSLTPLYGQNNQPDISNLTTLGGTQNGGKKLICQGSVFQVSFDARNFCPGTQFRVFLFKPGEQDTALSTETVSTPAPNTNTYTATLTMDGGTGNNRLVRVESIPPVECSQRSEGTSTNPIELTRLTVDVLAVTGATALLPTGAATSVVKADLQNGDVLTAARPRFWTAQVSGCPAEAVSMRLSMPGNVTFSTVENLSPWLLFANEGATQFWTINDPDRGLSAAYETGWPAGQYSLAVSLRSQDGDGNVRPKDRSAQGTVLGARTINFSIVDPANGRFGPEFKAVDVRTYPNPTVDRLSIDVATVPGQDVRLQLVDTQGNTVHTQTTRAESDLFHSEIDLSTQRAGLYVLRVATASGTETRKVIKASR